MRNSKTVGLFVFLLIVSVFLLQELIAANSESREWESSDGKYKVTAKFKEFNEKENKVVLVKKDGKEVSVPVAKLSQKDQDYIKKAAGNKKSDVDSFGQDDDTPPVKPDNKPIEKKSAETTKPRASDPKPDPSAPEKEPAPLSADDEKLAQELCKQLIAAYQPFKQPKWEKVWAQTIGPRLTGADFNKDGSLVITVDDANECVIRKLSDGTILEKKDDEFSKNVSKAAISPDGKYAATGFNSGVSVWEIESGKLAFKHEAPKGNIAAISFLRDGKTIAILDGESALSTYPVLGGYGKVMTRKSDETSELQDTLSVSSDAKKFHLTKIGSDRSTHYHQEYHIKDRPNALSGYRLIAPGLTVVGGMASNHFFINLNGRGYLSWAVADSNKPDTTSLGSQTTFPVVNCRAANSWDEKTSALVSHHGILAFPATNPALWRLIPPPSDQPTPYELWLLPDFEHVLVLGASHELSYWKISFKDQLIDVPLMRKLYAEKKFAVLDRAYLALDSDSQYTKQKLLQSWEERFMANFQNTIVTESNTEAGVDPADFRKWIESAPNTIGRLLVADAARGKAWSARGNGSANSVTDEGWKVFTAEMTKAKKILKPLMSRKQVPSQAIRLWFSVCQGTSWDHDDVDLGIQCMMRDHPESAAIHCGIAFSLLPRWYGKEGDLEKYAEGVSEKVDPKVKDVIYMQTMGSAIMPRSMSKPGFIFDDAQNPVRIYDSVKVDWDRMLRGADQLIELFPNDPAGVTYGLLYSVQSGNVEATKRYLKILDEKFSGLVAPHCKMTMGDIHFIRLELQQK